MNISKRARVLAAIVGSGIVVASSACGVDSTAPTPAPSLATPERVSNFVPSAANKALYGVVDGKYIVTFNPQVDQHFALGPNHLDIPANAVCNLTTSGYGPRYWNRSCVPETSPVTLTVTIKDAKSDKPQVDFQPAMRFSPTKNVSIFFYVPKATKEAAKGWIILHCPTLSGSGSGNCTDESLTDPSLQTYIDYTNSVLFRRIKHFSAYKVDTGYMVAD